MTLPCDETADKVTEAAGLVDRMVGLSNDLHDLLRDLDKAGGHYALVHSILQLATVHVHHASRAARAAEIIDHHKVLVGSKGTVLVRTADDTAVRITGERLVEVAKAAGLALSALQGVHPPQRTTEIRLAIAELEGVKVMPMVKVPARCQGCGTTEVPVVDGYCSDVCAEKDVAQQAAKDAYAQECAERVAVQREARIKADRCPDCGAGPGGRNHYSDCVRKR